MNRIHTLIACSLMAASLTACGSDTIVHEHPVVVQPAQTVAPDSDSVESKCSHGYDNRSHSCY